ncbi:hypothetical protein CU097_009099 [Rhizopus azygosporus]|uniref:Uncharacterized protein n=1 Tax=Rhizopus azygosporus TaxID=86630 RepID=A0A367K165_RHIAZ|nr:hypothetical protein CU097_009099 [Rhizopus azygosporus]
MFMRLIILELDRYSRLIKCIGLLLIGLRFADWPYELAFISIQQRIMAQNPGDDATCWAIWGSGVIVLNFIGDALANLFLSGMFVRRLFIHINSSKTIASQHNRLISSIARKSLICLTLTFFVNLVMNLLKVTMFLGNQSDAFTVYFELIESTLLVEALRNDSSMRAGPNTSICESCHKELSHNGGHKRPNNSEEHHSQMLVRSFSNHQNKKHSFISETDENTAYDENLIENITPVQPAMFHSKQHRHTHYQHQQKLSGDLSEQETHSFSTSLAPRPITSSSKDMFMSLNPPSAPLPPPPFSGESFAMINVEKDHHASHTSPTASRSESVANSSHSQPTSY